MIHSFVLSSLNWITNGQTRCLQIFNEAQDLYATYLIYLNAKASMFITDKIHRIFIMEREQISPIKMMFQKYTLKIVLLKKNPR